MSHVDVLLRHAPSGAGFCPVLLMCLWAGVQGLCAMFAPGNRHAIVGTKDGAIQILDIAASAVVETLKAHEGAVSPPDITFCCDLSSSSPAADNTLHEASMTHSYDRSFKKGFDCCCGA